MVSTPECTKHVSRGSMIRRCSREARQDHQERELILERAMILAFIFAGVIVAIVAIVMGIIDIRNGRRSMAGRTVGTFIAAGVLMLVGVVVALAR